MISLKTWPLPFGCYKTMEWNVFCHKKVKCRHAKWTLLWMSVHQEVDDPEGNFFHLPGIQRSPFLKSLCSTKKIYSLKWVELKPTPWLAMRGRNTLVWHFHSILNNLSFVDPFFYFPEIKLIRSQLFFFSSPFSLA